MKKYAKIGQLAQVVKHIVQQKRFVGIDPETKEVIYDNTKKLGTQEFVGTVKLHGTNAGIRRNAETGEITFQSRENVITPMKDNAGFALYMSSIEAELQGFFDVIRDRAEALGFPQMLIDHGDILIFGEWAGKGIQKSVGISEIEKSFFIFDICFIDTNESPDEDEEGEQAFYVDMRKYSDMEYPDFKIYNIWNEERFPVYSIVMDMENPKLVQNDIVAITDAVETECPVAKHFFSNLNGVKVTQFSDGKIEFDKEVIEGMKSVILDKLNPVFKNLRKDPSENIEIYLEF